MLDINEFINTDKLFDGHYRLLRPLNTEGGTADVWLAVDMNTIDGHSYYDEEELVIDESSALLVAIKIYRPKNALDIEGEQRFRDEFKVAFNCHHANLLQPTSFNIFQGLPYLVLPYCEAGSSEQFIGQELTNDKIWRFILDVASGLNRLHSNNPQIVHQDIKPANILIDDNGNFTITDFGISSKKTSMQESDNDEENSGTIAYMAPERFDPNTDARPESDIWAFGATLCEILTGRVPFGEDGGMNQLKGLSLPPLSGMSPELKSLIKWIERWEADGQTKIDGIGTQMHISCYANAQTQESKKKAIENMFKLMAATGKLVRVSELDMGYVDASGNKVLTVDMTEAQHKEMAELYKFVVQKYLEIIPTAQQWGICQWCATDAPANSGWRGGEPVGLWDKDYYRKHTYAGFADGLAGK